MDNINTIMTPIEGSIQQSVAETRDLVNEISQEILENTGVRAEDMEVDVIEEVAEEQEPISTPDTIRPNSPTLLVDESTSRFSGAIWAEAVTKKIITLAGLGGIGSYVGYLLSRMKPARIILYDPDIVEQANMSGQFFKRSQINYNKTAALAENMMEFSCYYGVYSNSSRFDETANATDIMICGFDNMAARKTFYEVWKRHVMGKPEDKRAECLFIDGRLAAEEFQVFCIKGDNPYHMKQYEDKWLFSDEEAEATICSYKQTSHCANMIASIMVNLFVNFIANQCGPLIDRDVPFLTSYDASTMYFKTVS